MVLRNNMEIIPKTTTEKKPKGEKFLTNFIILILILTIIASFSVIFIENSYQKKIKELNEKISQTQSEEYKSLEKELKNYNKKINLFQELINKHFLVSKIFPFLEERTHQKVFFQNFELVSGENKINLNGQTDNFLTLHQQILIFQNEPEIKETKLTNVSIGKEGRVDFELSLIFNSEILKIKK